MFSNNFSCYFYTGIRISGTDDIGFTRARSPLVILDLIEEPGIEYSNMLIVI